MINIAKAAADEGFSSKLHSEYKKKKIDRGPAGNNIAPSTISRATITMSAHTLKWPNSQRPAILMNVHILTRNYTIWPDGI